MNVQKKKTKKEFRNEYKLKKFRAGIFQIENKKEHRLFLKTSMNLDKPFNSDLFQLRSGMHPNQELQENWNSLVEENFELKIFDEIKLNETETPAEINKELNELFEMYLNELKDKGQKLY